MAEFAPPSGPPPPKVPEGWKAVWNAQYSEYFYVNIYTKVSQWDKPTFPAYPPGEAPPSGPPPSYGGGHDRPSMDKNNTGLSSNNPYASAQPNISEDERLARQLQEEEQARARTGGASGNYYGGAPANAYANPGGSSGYGAPQGQGYAQGQAQEKSKPKGFLEKLKAKASGASHDGQGQTYPVQPHGYPQQGYGAPGYGGGYGGGYGHGPPMGGMMGGMGGRRPGGGGMGMAGAGALGLGGGLLAGSMIGGAMGDDGDTYVENNYGDDGGMGGDMGGGDMGGGDF
ncbi:hypothetical protein BU23DRAFT_595115 [Bimuria novae-zelandiae CBS 107.79]|uniref:WW domain-containing protein n=1 Tax=Bimuria novae-zelandiae CBS 107.79 TaxID=1447943 RepID=A0A6A5VW80_9PLEO|nr:hypothetical protein BU23DRAFT_595115 [Bimuria novae-zelandiae CBS 107.79]